MRWVTVLCGVQRSQLVGKTSHCVSPCRWSCWRVPNIQRCFSTHLTQSYRSPHIGAALHMRIASRNIQSSTLWPSTWRRLGKLRAWGMTGLTGGVVLAVAYRKLGLHSTVFRRSVSCNARSLELEESSLPVPFESVVTPHDQPGFLQKCYLSFRFVYLSILFFPVVVLRCLSIVFHSPFLSNLSWKYMLAAIQIAGPAFVKLGQWASTRRDLFSEEFCLIFSCLHTRCNPHSWQDTVKILEDNLGADWQKRVLIPDMHPVGSGSVAQVYKGVLKVKEGYTTINTDTGQCTPDSTQFTESLSFSNQGSYHLPASKLRSSRNERDSRTLYVPIAVKVLHPGVVEQMERDIRVMKYVASWVDYIYPDVHWVALKECVDEFSHVMWKQLDLKEEAKNLLQFRHLLRDYPHVKFPRPILPYVTDSVLVESFEQGTQISNYMDEPGGPLQKDLAQIGIRVLLDMLFTHNLVHGDLHPGNILVQEEKPTLVILDCGIATSLSPLDLENFRAVFTAIVKGEGTKVADLMLGDQQCPTKEEYRRSMAKLVEAGRLHLNLKETDVGKLFSNLFNILIEHKVRIEPQYTCVMVAMMVIEGLGRSLDPSLDILAAARPVLLEKAKQTFQQKFQSFTSRFAV